MSKKDIPLFQIIYLQRNGQVNMLDFQAVQQAAWSAGFNELGNLVQNDAKYLKILDQTNSIDEEAYEEWLLIEGLITDEEEYEEDSEKPGNFGTDLLNLIRRR